MLTFYHLSTLVSCHSHYPCLSRSASCQEDPRSHPNQTRRPPVESQKSHLLTRSQAQLKLSNPVLSMHQISTLPQSRLKALGQLYQSPQSRSHSDTPRDSGLGPTRPPEHSLLSHQGTFMHGQGSNGRHSAPAPRPCTQHQRDRLLHCPRHLQRTFHHCLPQ